MINRNVLFRIFYSIIGVSIISIGLTFTRYAVLGLDPVTGLNVGIAKQIGLSFGTWQLIMFVILLVVIFIFDRSKIGFGTLYNMITVGYTSDFLLALIKNISIFESFSIQIRIVSFMAGMIIIYFGAAIYIEANMGLAPYDAIAIIIVEKINKQHLFRWVRMGTDALCVAGAIITKSNVGIGTVLTVLCAGPIIAFFIKLLRKMKIFQPLYPEHGYGNHN